MRIKVPANLMRALFAVVPKQDVRTYLMGVFYDAKDNELVATDGHRLLTVGDIEVINPIDLGEECIFQLPLETVWKSDTAVAIDLGENWTRPEEVRWTFFGKYGVMRKQVITKLVDAKYPDYKTIIRDKVKNGTLEKIGFNPAYIWDVYTALGYQGGAQFVMGQTENDPFEINMAHPSDKVRYILMPMRY